MVYVKRILSFLVFIAILIGMLCTLSAVFMPKNNQSEFGMEDVAANGILGEKENTIDVLILGDSEAYASISPMQIWRDTGYTSYVCATSGQPMDYTLLIMRRALERQNPKIIILETNALYRKVSLDSAAIAKLGGYFSIFSYHNRWKTLGVNDFMDDAVFTWVDAYKGYKFNLRVEPSKKTNHMKPTDKVAEIPELNVRYVKDMKAICDEIGAELIFVSTPSTRNWNYERHNGVKALAKKLGCEYKDLNLLNDKIKIDWSKDSRDNGDHMNHSGAKKVTEFISCYLSETGVLTDHRGDAAYAQWDVLIKKYEKKLKE